MTTASHEIPPIAHDWHAHFCPPEAQAGGHHEIGLCQETPHIGQISGVTVGAWREQEQRPDAPVIYASDVGGVILRLNHAELQDGLHWAHEWATIPEPRTAGT